jgi:hypothetical protein
MTTGPEIKAFANARGLIVIPYRNTDEWAKEINANGGKCICRDERTCPCEESLEDINSAISGGEACCVCRLLCNQRYVDAWYDSWLKQGVDVSGVTKSVQGKTAATKAKTVKKAEPQYVIKIPELQQAVDELDSAKKKLTEMETDDINKVIETFREVEKKITEDAKKHECEVCARLFGGLGRKLQFLQQECKIDPLTCSTEFQQTLTGIDGLKQDFINVDKEQSGAVKNEEPEGVTNNQPEREFRDDFHACTSGVMTDGSLDGVEKENKMCVASKMCAKDAKTKEEAIKECVKE